MSRIKKLTLILLAIILVMIINVKPVNATSRYFSYEDLCTNEKLLCTQHHQWMYGGNYNLSYTIEILGDTSTGNGKNYESGHNEKLAYILSK